MEGYVSGVYDFYDDDFTGTTTEAPKLPDFNWEPSKPLSVLWPARPLPNPRKAGKSRMSIRKSFFGGSQSTEEASPGHPSTLQVPSGAKPHDLPDAGKSRMSRLRDNAYSSYFAWMPNNFTAVETAEPAKPNDPTDARRRTTILVDDAPARPGSFYPQNRPLSSYPGQRPMSSFPGRPMSTHPTAAMVDYYAEEETTPPVPSVPTQQQRGRFRKPRDSFARSAVLSYAPSLAPVPSSPTGGEGKWQRLEGSEDSRGTSRARLSLATSRPGSHLEVDPDSKHSPTYLMSPDSPDPNATPIVPDNAHILTTREEQNLESESGGDAQLRRSRASQMQTQQAPQYPQPMEAKVEMAPPQETILVNWDGPDDPANPKNWTYRKRWNMTIIMAIFAFVTPFSSSAIAPALPQVSKLFGVSNGTEIELFLSIFVLGYAFGPLFWAPMSEIYGRLKVLHMANWLFLIFTIACSVSQDSYQLYVFRFFAGLTGSAPLGVGAGTLQDMWPPEQRGKFMGIYTLGPLLGPSLGPIVGGWIAGAGEWRWIFRVVYILDALLLVFALFVQRETYAPKILGDKAARLRYETGNYNYRTKFETTTSTPRKKLTTALARPAVLIGTQPIIVLLGVFMAYLYGLQYLVIGSFSKLWTDTYGESLGVGGLNFFSLGIGLVVGSQIGSRTAIPLMKYLADKYGNGETQPEHRIALLFPAVFFVPIGTFIYGWTAEYKLFWLLPNIGVFFVGLGTIFAFQSIQNYTIDTFALYAASAMAAVTGLRSLAGFAFPLFSDELYGALGYGWGNSLLGFVAIGIGFPTPFFLWKYGAWLRSRSTIAMEAEKTKNMAKMMGSMTPEKKKALFAKLSIEDRKEIATAGGFAGLAPERKAELLKKAMAAPEGAGGGGGMAPEKKAKLMAALTPAEKMEIAAAGGFAGLTPERKAEFLSRIGGDDAGDKAEQAPEAGADEQSAMSPEKKAQLMGMLTVAEKMEIAGAGGFKNLSPERRAEFLAKVDGNEEEPKPALTPSSGSSSSEASSSGSPTGDLETTSTAPEAGAVSNEQKQKLMAILSPAEKMEVASAGGFKNLPAGRKAAFLAKLNDKVAEATPPSSTPEPASGPLLTPQQKVKLMQILSPAEKGEVLAAGGIAKLSPEQKAKFIAKLDSTSTRGRSPSPGPRQQTPSSSTSAFAGSQDPFSDDHEGSGSDENMTDHQRMLQLAESMGGLTDEQKAKVKSLRKGGLPNAKKLGLSSTQKMRFAAAQIGGLTDEQKRRLQAAKEQGANAAARQTTLPNVSEE